MIIKQKVYFQIHLQNNKNSIFITKHEYIQSHNDHYFTCSKNKI